MQLQPLIGEQYNFIAPPKVIKPRAKFRDENNPIHPTNEPAEEEENKNSFNLMWDKRVVRGNTYASMVTKKGEDPLKEHSKATSKQPKPILKTPKPLSESTKNTIDIKVDTPKAVSGRVHASVSTEPFIEILTDKPLESEKEALTDFYIDRPVNRLFVYKKDGVDQEAQIWEGDLFDFDTEVEPILQVLLGKALEQGRMEVLEEEELKVMKEQQRQFEQMRNAELAEMQRLESKEARMLEEIEKRKLQYSKQKDQLIYAHQKLISRLCSKKLLKYIKPNAFDKLEDLGVFRNPLEFGLYNDYIPWIIESIAEDLLIKDDQEADFSQILDEMQDSVKETHAEALKRREKFIEAKRSEVIRKQEEKIENIKKRKEEKIRKNELQRIQEIKDKIQNKIFARNDIRQHLNTLTISDIDNYERPSIFLGVFGGFVGELIRFLEKLFEILEAKQMNQEINVESLEKIVMIFLDSFLVKGVFEIEIDEECLKDLIVIDPNFNIDLLSASKVKVGEIVETLRRNLSGMPLNLVRNRPGAEELAEKIVEIVLKYSIEQEKGKNIKFVKAAKRTDFTNKIALCRIAPKIETLTLRPNLLELYQKIDPNFDPNSHSMMGLWEAELEDKYTAVVPYTEDVRVFVIQQIAQIMLRRNFINDLRTQFPEIQSIEFYLEEELVKTDNEMIPKTLKELNKELLILDFEMY